jgi:tetratricopeptide (TPR) repeat protein
LIPVPQLLARRGACLVAALAVLSAGVLGGCTAKPMPKVAWLPEIDTMGQMPCERDNSLVPNLSDPKIKSLFDKTVECAAQSRSLHREGERDGTAIGFILPALAETEQALGPKHCFVGDLCHQAGTSLLNANDVDAAEPYIRRAIAIRTTYLGDGCIDTARSVCTLANILVQQGKTQQAWDLLNEHWQRAQKQPPSLNAKVSYLYHMGFVLSTQNKWNDAQPYFRQAVALKLNQPWLRALQPDALKVLEAASECAIRLNDFDYATTTLAEAVRLRFGRRRPIDQSTCTLLMMCADHWLQQHNDAKALPCLQGIIELSHSGGVIPTLGAQAQTALDLLQSRRRKG